MSVFTLEIKHPQPHLDDRGYLASQSVSWIHSGLGCRAREGSAGTEQYHCLSNNNAFHLPSNWLVTECFFSVLYLQPRIILTEYQYEKPEKRAWKDHFLCMLESGGECDMGPHKRVIMEWAREIKSGPKVCIRWFTFTSGVLLLSAAAPWQFIPGSVCPSYLIKMIKPNSSLHEHPPVFMLELRLPMRKKQELVYDIAL